METEKTSSSQGNLDLKEQSWRYHMNESQNILQSYNDQNNIVLQSKQTHRPTE
jgi:hypothetical protein